MRRRLQIDFTQDNFEKLKKIKELSGSQTNAEAVRKAICLYEWFLQKREEGAQVQIIDGSRTSVIELLF